MRLTFQSPSPPDRAAALDVPGPRGRARHEVKVARVARQLRAHDGSRPVSLRKRAVSHQVPKQRDLRHEDPKIDVSDLDEILAIDPVARTCTAEPGVTFTALVEATLRHGLVPLVVPELETITIGGAVAGCSLESMSFRYGGFHDTCLAYEVLTATGEVVRCTPDGPTPDDALLFQMMHGSFGTLGVLTELTFRLVPAEPFVHVRYETHASLASYERSILRHAEENDVDFMDGILHAPDRLVLSLGRFEREAPYTSRYDWTEVYWESTATRREDHLRTRDYFFRYDRGVTNVHPRSKLGRLLFGKLLGSDRLLRMAQSLRRVVLSDDRPTVTLDTFLPISQVDGFMRWYDGAIGHYPLWCVPYRRVRDYEWISKDVFGSLPDTMFLDIAIYGLEQPPGRNLYAEIEQALLGFHGIKTLISYNYYDEETFWRIFDRERYAAVKRRTDPRNVFRDLFTKTCRAARGL